MQFVENLSKEEYTKFWESTPNNHFMQSYEWGIANEKNRHLTPYYVGLKDDNGKILISALLLKKQLPFNLCSFYSPRGYNFDYQDLTILKTFTDELKKFLQKEKAVSLKVDPPIKYQTIDLEAQKIDGENNYPIFDAFIECGYKHGGFNKLYEGNQPRYTFRTYFAKYANFEDVQKTFSKSYVKNIRRSYNYDLKLTESDDIKTFHNLIKINAEKSGFHEYSYEYYQNVYNELSTANHVRVLNLSVDPQHLIAKFTDELATEKDENRLNKIQKDLEYFKNLPNQEEHVIVSQILTYSKTGAWTLYIGSDETAQVTNAVPRMYYEVFKDTYDKHYEYLDLFGTVGDPHTTYKNLAGIFEHKRMLGGDYIEFLGEFNLINKPFWYKAIPLLQKVRHKLKIHKK